MAEDEAGPCGVQVRAEDAESPFPVKGTILKTKSAPEDKAKQGEPREAELELRSHSARNPHGPGLPLTGVNLFLSQLKAA